MNVRFVINRIKVMWTVTGLLKSIGHGQGEIVRFWGSSNEHSDATGGIFLY